MFFRAIQTIALFLLLAAVPSKNVEAAGFFCRFFNFCAENAGEISAFAQPYFDARYQVSSVEEAKQNEKQLIVDEIALAKTSFLEDFDQENETESNNKRLVIVYTVKNGDNVYDIANYFGISTETIIWANNLSGTNPIIRSGDKLTILPISGVQHKVKQGETLSLIASKYFKPNEYEDGLKDIMEFNGINESGFIQAGQLLLIPGGEMPAPKNTYKYAEKPKQQEYISDLSDYFDWPIPAAVATFTRTREPHLKYGVDIGSKIDNISCLNSDGSQTPVFASADGIVTTVIKSNSRWSGGYGNYIIIHHQNGTVTYYAHLYADSILVEQGESVMKGQQIASVGGGFEWLRGRMYKMKGAGTSTGCHLHFEVRGAPNPFVAIHNKK